MGTVAVGGDEHRFGCHRPAPGHGKVAAVSSLRAHDRRIRDENRTAVAREIEQGSVILCGVETAVIVDEQAAVIAGASDLQLQLRTGHELNGAWRVGGKLLGPYLKTGEMRGRVRSNQATAANVVGIQGMACNQLLDVVQRGLCVLENALLALGGMGFDRTGDDELLSACYHPAAARAGTDAEVSRVEHYNISTGTRELDGCRQSAVAAADDCNVDCRRKLDVRGRLWRRGFPPIGGGLEPRGKASRHGHHHPANLRQPEAMRPGLPVGSSIIM